MISWGPSAPPCLQISSVPVSTAVWSGWAESLLLSSSTTSSSAPRGTMTLTSWPYHRWMLTTLTPHCQLITNNTELACLVVRRYFALSVTLLVGVNLWHSRKVKVYWQGQLSRGARGGAGRDHCTPVHYCWPPPPGQNQFPQPASANQPDNLSLPWLFSPGSWGSNKEIKYGDREP